MKQSNNNKACYWEPLQYMHTCFEVAPYHLGLHSNPAQADAVQ